jgi:CO/xanthine dehydrogenase FAD-binding subunit
VKPPVFEYFAPKTLDEALTLTERYASTHKLLAGGQSLVPAMNMRLVRPEQLIDLNGVPDLDGIADTDDYVVVGAMTRHRVLEFSKTVRRKLPLLAEALPLIGHVQIRNRGTVGGSICHADPAAEIATVWTALGGDAVVIGALGERVVPVEELLVSVFTTSLEPGEILKSVRFRKPAGPSGAAFAEVSRRHGDYALASAAVSLSLEDGRIVEPRIALGSVADRPVRATDAERLLVGAEPGDDVFAAAAAAVQGQLDPWSDVHASVDYRRHVAAVLTRRCLALAVSRADGHS